MMCCIETDAAANTAGEVYVALCTFRLPVGLPTENISCFLLTNLIAIDRIVEEEGEV
jgi:hypothetical protein